MSKQKNNYLQYFRGLLFLAVLGFHCGVPGFSPGWGSVEAFFVIISD